jgi:hypothetical protein
VGGRGAYHDERSTDGVPRVLELLLSGIAPLGGLFGLGFVALELGDGLRGVVEGKDAEGREGEGEEGGEGWHFVWVFFGCQEGLFLER